MEKDASTDKLEAVRIEVEGPTASFRYAHFLIGRQPTYPMPPPSTIYGMIAGALGDYPDPSTIKFAYRFHCARETVDDVERIWKIFSPDTKWMTREYNVQAQSDVLPREWLVQPRMTLYLTGSILDKLHSAFRVPHYLPVLGRSQDLVSYRSVERVQLERRSTGRFDESLLPIALRDRLNYGSSINFPRFINPRNRLEVDWDWFVALDQPVTVGAGDLFEPNEREAFWADPESADEETGRERLLMFHGFNGERDAGNSGPQG